jgi:hypothetical protein
MVAPLFLAQAFMIGAEYVQGVKNAKAMAKYNQKLQDQSIENAAAFASSSYGALQARSQQINDALHQSEFQARRDARKASATEAVSAAESGVTGISVADVQQEFAVKLDEFLGISEKQTDHELAQVNRQMDAIRIQQQNSIFLGDPVAQPSAFVAGASIFAAYLSTKAKNPSVTPDAGTQFSSNQFDITKSSPVYGLELNTYNEGLQLYAGYPYNG